MGPQREGWGLGSDAAQPACRWEWALSTYWLPLSRAQLLEQWAQGGAQATAPSISPAPLPPPLLPSARLYTLRASACTIKGAYLRFTSRIIPAGCYRRPPLDTLRSLGEAIRVLGLSGYKYEHHPQGRGSTEVFSDRPWQRWQRAPSAGRVSTRRRDLSCFPPCPRTEGAVPLACHWVSQPSGS